MRRLKVVLFLFLLTIALPCQAQHFFSAQSGPEGSQRYLRELDWFKNYIQNDQVGQAFEFFSPKNIWLFGEGEAMFLEWIKQGNNFKIRYFFLDKDDMAEFLDLPTTVQRNQFIGLKSAGALTQETGSVFADQTGLYSYVDDEDQFQFITLRSVLFNPGFNFNFSLNALLDAKYGADQGKRDAFLALRDHLAMDIHMYPASGNYAQDTRIAVYFPGYRPGMPPILGGGNTTARGWNSVISIGKDPNYLMDIVGLDYLDLVAGHKRWIVVMGANTHLDYDGKHTPSKGVSGDEADHTKYVGLLTPVDSHKRGLVYRALPLLTSAWAGVPLSGERNVISHSTGHYFAMDFLHHMPSFWPTPLPADTKYFGISPNLKGSTMIGAGFYGQRYDSMDDMYRDNWHWNNGYRLNETTRGFGEYRFMNDVKSYFMFAFGDTTSGGVGGLFTIAGRDVGVVDYSNFQPHFGNSLDPENLDDHEYARIKRFTHYESLYNFVSDWLPSDPLLSEALPTWLDGGDGYLRKFPEEKRQISVFGEHVNLKLQGIDRDDSENYRMDHVDLDQRTRAIHLILEGNQLDLSPPPGQPLSVETHPNEPGKVLYSWARSSLQSLNPQDITDGPVGGQVYEVVRKIQGNQALAGYLDRWWQRVGLRSANVNQNFQQSIRVFETVRGVESVAGHSHGIWNFFSSTNGEYLFMPTWLDQAFGPIGSNDLWVRVHNGALKGGFFKVINNFDYMGIGFSENRDLDFPATFPDKLKIQLFLQENPEFSNEQPQDDNYLTLGGIKYLFHSAYYGPIPSLRASVNATTYVKEKVNETKGTGHFLSTELSSSVNPADPTSPVAYPTDTIAPLIDFS